MSEKFVLDMALRNAANGILAFWNGHAWSDTLGAPYSEKALIVSKWRRGELDLTLQELLKAMKFLADGAAPYAKENDIYGYEASYVVWAVGFVERLITPPPAEEV